MRKLLLVIFLFVFALPLFSQNISYRDETDNRLLVGTTFCYESKGALLVDFKPRTAIALSYNLYKDTGEEYFMISFALQTYEHEFTFDKNAPLYIKTFQNSIVVITQLLHDVQKDKKRVNDKSDAYYYFVYPSFVISKEDLTSLMQEGIQKLSFMTTAGYHTLTYENDTVAAILVKEYDALMGKTNFDEGF